VAAPAQGAVAVSVKAGTSVAVVPGQPPRAVAAPVVVAVVVAVTADAETP
jgi:hypothetical protein